jgi:hypothetical protein
VADQGWLNVVDAAARLGMSRSAFQRLAAEEGLPIQRHGRADAIRVVDLDAYVESCRVKPGDLTGAVRRAASRADPGVAKLLGVTLVDKLTECGWSEGAICRELGLNPTAVSHWRVKDVPTRWVLPLRTLLLRPAPVIKRRSRPRSDTTGSDQDDRVTSARAGRPQRPRLVNITRLSTPRGPRH